MDSLLKKSIIIIITLICLFNISVISTNANPAATANFIAAMDTEFCSEWPDYNYGAETSFDVGFRVSGSWIMHGLFYFDLSSCQGITQATLYIYTNQLFSSSFTANIHIVEEAWVESSNWNSYIAYNSAVNATMTLNSGYQSVDLTALAQDWESGAVTNYGILLEDDDGSNFAIVATSEASSNQPYLAITATSVTPEGNPIILFTSAALCIMCCIVYYKKRTE